MNLYFFIAAVICLIVGIVHSVMGEKLIFQAKRAKGKIVPSIGSKDLRQGHLRIIWATWHLASVLGWVLAAILIQIAQQAPQSLDSLSAFIVNATVAGMLIGSILVLYGTSGRHPGWIGLLLVAILLVLGQL